MNGTDVLHGTSGWIQSASNTKISFVDPDPDAFNINDIALALSRQPRFSGHGKFFYSVAQHSVYVASQVQPENRMYALLHDAHEAYTGDVPGPLKELLGQRLLGIERKLQRAIHTSLGLNKEPSTAAEIDIMLADKAMLEPEYHALYDKHIWHVNGVEPAPIDVIEWEIREAEAVFLYSFYAILSSNDDNHAVALKAIRFKE